MSIGQVQSSRAISPPRGPWSHTSVNGDRPLELLIAGENPRWALLAAPRLRRRDGAPLLSLVALLHRAPNVGEALDALVDRVVLSGEVDVAPSDTEMRALTDATGYQHRAVFPRLVAIHVTAPSLGEAPVPGDPAIDAGAVGGSIGVFQATLFGEMACAALLSAYGATDAVLVEARVGFRAAVDDSGNADRRLRVDLGRLEQDLLLRTGPERLLTDEDLRHYLPALLASGTLTIEPQSEATGEADVGPILTALLRAGAPVLRRADAPDDPELGHVYRLGKAVGTSVATISSNPSGQALEASGELVLTIPLTRLVEQVRGDAPPDAVVRLVIPGPDGAPISLPRLVVHEETTRTRALPSFLAERGRVTSAFHAVTPSLSEPATHVLVHTQLADPIATQVGVWALDDATAAEQTPQPGPVLEPPDASTWPDHADTQTRWYAPGWRFMAPELNQPIDDSPFAFRFRTIGHGPDGRPRLEATIRLVLEQVAPPDAGDAQPVALEGVSAALLVPSLDDTGQVRVEQVPCATVADGVRLVVTATLTDQWARAAYGALSVPGFQPVSPRVSVAYRYWGWTSRPVHVFAGATMLRVPVVDQIPPDADPELAVDATSTAVRSRDGTLLISKPSSSTRATHPAVQDTGPQAVALTRPSTLVTTMVLPEIQLRPETAVLVEELWRRSFARISEIEVMVPCATFGHLYVEERPPAPPRAISCLQAYQLGETTGPAWEDVGVAAVAGVARVMRSTVTPGRFLVVPRTYRIGRYDGDDPVRGWRPAIVLFSSVDVSEPTRTQCVLVAALQPDLPPDVRAKMEEELRSLAPAPQVVYVTELPGTATIRWALPNAPGGLGVTSSETRTWDGFRVALTTNAPGILALQAMLGATAIHGDADFVLADGTQIGPLALELDLRRIVGPWRTGPVEAARDGDYVRLVNRIESPVRVSDLLARRDGELVTVPVEAVLAPGAEQLVSLSQQDVPSAVAVSVEPTSTSLTELRAYVEDLDVEVAFLCRVRLEQRGLVGVDVTVRLQGSTSDQHVQLRAGALAVNVRLMLPLTTFAADPVLEWRVQEVGEAGLVGDPSPWQPWRLSTRGYLITVSDELFG